jgi:hypothetical protein
MVRMGGRPNLAQDVAAGKLQSVPAAHLRYLLRGSYRFRAAWRPRRLSLLFLNSFAFPASGHPPILALLGDLVRKTS